MGLRGRGVPGSSSGTNVCNAAGEIGYPLTLRDARVVVPTLSSM